jgi:RNA-directed DNA polymerase
VTIRDIFIALGCSSDAADTLTHFTTFNRELPQGAPTSPVLSNFVLHPFDERVRNLCRIKRFSYSRYFDDVAISGDVNPSSTCQKIVEICSNLGFRINTKDPRKFRITNKDQDQIVTGLIVNNNKLKVSLSFLAKLENNLCRRKQL